MISDTINKQIAKALKKQDKLRVSVLRMLSSALNYKRIERQHDLSEEDEIAVVKAEAKKRKDVIKIYKKLQNSKTPDSKIEENIIREEGELKILREYLPEEMSDEEISKLVESAITEAGAKAMSEMGRVIGIVMGKAKGRADGARVSVLVRSKLT